MSRLAWTGSLYPGEKGWGARAVPGADGPIGLGFWLVERNRSVKLAAEQAIGTEGG